MPAGDQQQQIGKVDPVGQAHGQRMALQMVDREKGLAAGRRHGLGGHHADEDPADQAGSRRRRDAVDPVQRQARILQGTLDQPVEVVEMAARRDLRHHAAVGAVLVQLRQHEVGQNPAPCPVGLDAGGSGLIARGFNAQKDHAPQDKGRAARLQGGKARCAC